MNKLCCNFQKYRNELFGISILSIMIFHYFEDVSNAKITGALGYAAKGYIFFIGSSGVEIFLFLSGMGLFYSLSKSPLVLPFYKRRLGRVLPTYLIVGGIGWLVIDILLKRRGLRSFLSDFSTYSFWRYGERLVWYVSLILLLYLFFPLLFRLFSIKNKPLSTAALWELFAFFFFGIIIIYCLAPGFYKHTEIALWRVFPFIIGAWYGKKQYNGEKTGKAFAAAALAGLVLKLAGAFVGKSAPFPLSLLSLRLNNLLYPLIVMLAFTALLSLIDKRRAASGKEKKRRWALSWLGSISFELYLCHVILRRISKTAGLPNCNFAVWTAYIAISLAAAVGVKLALDKVIKKRRKRAEGKASAD